MLLFTPRRCTKAHKCGLLVLSWPAQTVDRTAHIPPARCRSMALANAGVRRNRHVCCRIRPAGLYVVVCRATVMAWSRRAIPAVTARDSGSLVAKRRFGPESHTPGCEMGPHADVCRRGRKAPKSAPEHLQRQGAVAAAPAARGKGVCSLDSRCIPWCPAPHPPAQSHTRRSAMHPPRIRMTACWSPRLCSGLRCSAGKADAVW